jgi:hypothetical protein
VFANIHARAYCAHFSEFSGMQSLSGKECHGSSLLRFLIRNAATKINSEDEVDHVARSRLPVGLHAAVGVMTLLLWLPGLCWPGEPASNPCSAKSSEGQAGILDVERPPGRHSQSCDLYAEGRFDG